MRIPDVKREDLSPTDQVYYDEIVQSRGGIRGPFPALLHSPQLASLVAATGHYARFDCILPNPLREVAIICASRENRNQYVFTAHVRLAREAGVSEGIIDAVKRGDLPDDIPEDEAMVMRFVRELVGQHKVSDSSFNAVVKKWGTQGAVDLTGVVAHYMLVMQVINAFDIQHAEGVTLELPV